ncbi:hypothetical protein GWK47_005401 [Chionoecetes opilio]|uniref:Uncharacterized protein n=1 Tax=Chionoecetes opilio TaxID=41210 RepID=A0A8J4YAX0_CHIOP|nr:hypothetical protein GWK47_005401 [Chionoecetes opilio]
MLARQEELNASDKRQQVDHGEHQLHTLLQAIRTAASGVEAYKTIEASDHVMEEETQREEECLARLPDVHTVTTLNKVRRRGTGTPGSRRHRPGAQQTADVGGGAAGDASLTCSSGGPPHRYRVRCPDVNSLEGNLLQRGLVFAVHTTAGRSRQVASCLEDDPLYLHFLRDQPLPRGRVALQVGQPLLGGVTLPLSLTISSAFFNMLLAKTKCLPK